jgi:hypothetical protein
MLYNKFNVLKIKNKFCRWYLVVEWKPGSKMPVHENDRMNGLDFQSNME